MKYAIVCAGGPEAEIPDLTSFKASETVFIGADRGAFHLLERGIIPQEAVGDFDSVSQVEYERIENAVHVVGQFNCEKDETDTELAVIRALAYEPKKIILTGVTDGRLDHMVSALHLICRFQQENPAIAFSIVNKTNELSVLLPGSYEIMRHTLYAYISFFAFGSEVNGLTLSGFKYETEHATLETGMTKFTSNELSSEICTISFHAGICLMVRSADA